MSVDNVVIGEPLVPLESLGVAKTETTVRFSFEDVRNDKGEVFLPAVLKRAGIFDTTNQIKQVNQQRMKSDKIIDPLSKNLWRNLDGLEFTHFKVGRKVLWLIVGE